MTKTAFALSLILFIISFGYPFHIVLSEERKPLSLADIENLIKNDVSNKRIAIIIAKYGIDFAVTERNISKLRRLGADKVIIAAIRQAYAEGEIKKGSLYVDSTPSGSEVFVDGLYRGNTPLHIDHLLPGKINLKVGRLEGYKDYESEIAIQSNKMVTVKIPLERTTSIPQNIKSSKETELEKKLKEMVKKEGQSPRPEYFETHKGHIYVNSDPPSANIYIDGTYKADTPAELSLLPGEYMVMFIRKNYKVETIPLNIKKGINLPLSVRLSPD